MSRTVARRRLAIKMQVGVLGALLALAALAALAGPAAAQVPPDQDWRTITTERARVTFPVHLEPLARRAAHRAEVALDELAEAFIEPPEGPIDIVLTDHTDFSNGFAQVTPSNRITIFARPPADELGLGYFDDWLELVLTHEIAHVVHLDHTASGLGRLLRAVFGRVPGRWPFFPGFGTPRWLIEGLATWFESDLTASGRLQGTFHEMQLRTAVIEDRFEGIDQASALSPVWPAGNRSYAYGSLFFDHLMARHGEDSMADFAEAVAGQWIPYRMNAAGRSAFGQSLSDAWREWGDSLGATYAHLDADLRKLGPITEPEHLTRGARWTTQPRVAADGTLAYAKSDGRSDPHLALRVVGDAGRADPALDADIRRVRVNGIVTFDWLPDGRLLVSQLEYQDPYRLHNDLYVVERDGSTRRLTRGARLGQPAAEPGGRTAVAVQEGEGTNALVRVDLSTGAVTRIVPPVPGEHWAYPSVSPDGRWIAATRWRTGGYHDVLVLDAASGAVRSEVTRDRALDHAPSWSPDGRWIVWASDRTGILNVLGAEIDPETGAAGLPRLLTNVRTGATYPSVSPDGLLYFSVYHADGWDVARTPFRPVDASEAPPAGPRFTTATSFEDGTTDAPVEGYSPFPSLMPRYWSLSLRPPVRTPDYPASSLFPRSRELLGFAIGAGTSGRDLVGRHAYDAFARVFTTGGKFEAGAAYAFLGLGNPVITVSGAQYYDDGGVLLPQPAEDVPPDTLFVLERERAIFATTAFQSRRWRRSAQLSLSAGVVEEHDELLGNDLEPSTEYRLTRPTSRLGELRASLRLSTARSFAFQLGGSKGLDLLLSARGRRDWTVPDSLRGMARSDRSFEDVVGRLRGYLPIGGPGYAPHVLAAQLVGGVANGPEAAGGHFEVGGTSGTPETLTGLALFGGSPELFGVRGYREAARLGRYAWAASGEYRFPLALVHRGLGAWPVYLGRLSGALFADAGDAWDPGADEGAVDPGRRILASVGGELAAEIILLYDFGMLFRTGVAFPLVDGRGTQVYVGLGLPF